MINSLNQIGISLDCRRARTVRQPGSRLGVSVKMDEAKQEERPTESPASIAGRDRDDAAPFPPEPRRTGSEDVTWDEV